MIKIDKTIQIVVCQISELLNCHISLISVDLADTTTGFMTTANDEHVNADRSISERQSLCWNTEKNCTK